MITRGARIAIVAVALAASPARAQQPAQKDAPKQKAVQDKALAAQLDRKIPEIHFQGQGLADVIDFLRDVTGSNLHVDWRSLEAAGVRQDAAVTAKTRGLTFKAALELILASAGTPGAKLQWEAQDGVIVISTAARKDPRVVGKLSPQLDRVLPDVNFNGQSLADVVDFLRDVSGKNIFVNWQALEAAGFDRDAPVTVRLQKANLSTILRLALESASDGRVVLEFGDEDGVITIKPAAKEQTTPGKPKQDK